MNIWEGSVRASKTVASIIRFIQFVGREAGKGVIPMVGKTERTLKTNILDPMKTLCGRSFHYSMGNHTAWLFGRELALYGASDERAEQKIRGLTAAGAYGDEITLWPESFYQMLLSRMSVEGAKFFGTTNPDNPFHWFKTGTLDRAEVLDLFHAHFLIDDNPFLDPMFVVSLKKEYTGVWYERMIEGKWVMAEGAVYPFFDKRSGRCVIKRHPAKADYYFAACDYGTENAFVMLLFGVNERTKPRVWCEREYYYSGRDERKQKTDVEYSADMDDFFGDIRPRVIYVDPSASSFIAELKHKYVVKHADNDVANGIRTQSRMLKTGEYAICECCEHTIEEYGGYVWDAKAALIGEDKPIKKNDHCKDAERYGLHTQFGDSKKYLLNRLVTM